MKKLRFFYGNKILVGSVTAMWARLDNLDLYRV